MLFNKIDTSQTLIQSKAQLETTSPTIHFLAFVTDVNEGWYAASFYAEGRDEILKQLQNRFGNTVNFSLVNSTDFNSRVWWPKEFAGEPMFEFIKGTRFLGKLGLTNNQVLGEKLKTFILQTHEVKH